MNILEIADRILGEENPVLLLNIALEICELLSEDECDYPQNKRNLRRLLERAILKAQVII